MEIHLQPHGQNLDSRQLLRHTGGMQNREWIQAELAALQASHARRTLRRAERAGGWITIEGERMLNLAGNDYLGLAQHPHVLAQAAAALQAAGAGAAASRLITGSLALHQELEERLARLKGCPTALVFGSGYLANLGILQAAVGRDDVVFADRLAHASLLDAAGLSRARLVRFHHNNPGHLADLLRKTPARRRLVLTESVFSMDGDVAPLADLCRAAADHDAMVLVDEAHATGIFGPGGSGLVRAAGQEQAVDFSMGTLSKALGSYGGFVACAPEYRDLLVNRARAFIYTTALPPPVLGAALGALDVLADHPGLGAELLARADRFRAALRAAGLDTGASTSQVIPVMVGDNQRTLDLAARLRAAGVMVGAIRPPTVPLGAARLRVSLTLAAAPGDLDRAAAAIVTAAHAVGLP